MANRPQIKVEGLRELSRALKKLDDDQLPGALKEANVAMAKDVVARALPNVPVRTGRLLATVRGLGSLQSATVKAGTAAVPYAAAIHWGRKQGGVIKARPFLRDAAQTVDAQAADSYEKAIKDLIHRAGLD